MAKPKKKKQDLSEVTDNLMKKYSIEPQLKLAEPPTKLSIITTAKRRLNKSHRATIKEIDSRFEDLSEDIDMMFDDLEHKLNYKFKQIIEARKVKKCK